MMDFSLPDTVALLSRTPRVLDSLLRGLPASWTESNEGANTWTAFDVVGHLIHGDRTDYLARVRIILADGESRPFPPFDRLAQKEESRGKTLGRLLDEFAALREENLSALGALRLQPQDLLRRGLHPRLGPVTLQHLLATWAAHDLTHVHQLSRVLAHQVRESVGPWSAFLGVLHCNGHSQ